MDKDKLQAFANELAKDVKTPEDLSTLSAILTKLTVEAALKAEMVITWVMTRVILQAITAAMLAMASPQKYSKALMVK